MQRDLRFPHKLFEKAVKNQVARQDSRHGGPEESRDAKHVLKLVQRRWTGHIIRMPDERLPKKVFYGELKERKRSQGDNKKRFKDTLKAFLKCFDIPIGSWVQTAQDQSKLRGHINKGAAFYEKKENL